MDIQSVLIFLLIGAIAGWLAGTLLRGRGFGLVGNMVVGVIGAILGGVVFSVLGIPAGGLPGAIATATAGAVVLLLVAGLLKKN